MSTDKANIPEHIMQALQRYVERGEYPGNFLKAVICNNLVDAINRADSESLAALPAIVAWLYNEAPAKCWRTEEKLDAWVERGGRVGNQDEE